MTHIKASNGFTLIEVLLALGITALIASMFTTIAFQLVKTNTRVNNRLMVVNDLQIAAKWLYLDAERADLVDLVDGGPPTDAMTVNWTSGVTPHESEYYVSGTELLRDHNGVVLTVGRNISNVDFSLSERLLTVNLTSSTSDGSISKQATYLIYIKPTE